MSDLQSWLSRSALRRLAVPSVLAITLAVSSCAAFGDGDAASTRSIAVVDASAHAAALAAEAGHDYQAAAGSWTNLYQRHPDDPSIALNLARNLRYAGQMQPAIDVASGFMERHGASAPLLTELGKDYLAADRLGLAVRTLRQAVDAAPKDWNAASALGVALDYQGNHGEAQQTYQRALALSPDNPQLLNNLGLSQAEGGQLTEAEATLQQAADQPKATTQVRQNLALVKALSGDATAAERLSRQDLPPEMARANSTYYRLLAGAARLP